MPVAVPAGRARRFGRRHAGVAAQLGITRDLFVAQDAGLFDVGFEVCTTHLRVQHTHLPQHARQPLFVDAVAGVCS